MAPNSSPLAYANGVSSRILEAIGIDADQFRALLRISLWIDFRGSAQAMAAGHTTDNPLKGSLILYGILSAIPAFLVFAVPVETFSRGVMTIDMLFLLMIMLVDFGVTLVVADDMRTVGWRPISSRTYLAARLANMILLISMFDLALFLAPAIVGAFARKSSYWFPLVFLPSALLAGVFVAGIVAACYTTLLRLFRPERFRGVLNAFQVAFLMLLVLVGQIAPHVHHKGARRPAFSPVNSAIWTWADLSPANWFSAPAELLVSGPSQRTIALSAIAVVATFGLFAVLLSTLSLDYLQKIAAAGEASPGRGSTSRGVALWRRAVGVALRSPEERMMFDYVREIFLRDREIRLRAYPSLAYAFVPGILVLFQSTRSEHLMLLAPAAIAGLLPIPLLTQFPYWGESHGEWIFSIIGFESFDGLAIGIKKAIFFTFQLPALLLFSIPLIFLAGPAQTGAAILLALGIAFFILELSFLLMAPGLPFTQEMQAGSAAGKMGVAFATTAALGVVGATVYFFANTPLRIAVVGLTLLLAGFALDAASNARFTIDEPDTFRGSGSNLFS
jgi:ABC-2 type transport system permease protein